MHFAARELLDMQAFAPGELIVPPTEATLRTSVFFVFSRVVERRGAGAEGQPVLGIDVG